MRAPPPTAARRRPCARRGRSVTSSSPASRSSGAKALTSAGTGAPGGRQRASVRAAVAATSGAASAPRAEHAPAALPASVAGSAGDGGGDRGQRGVGAIAALGQHEAVRVGEHGLGIGQVGLGEPGEELDARRRRRRAADQQRRALAARRPPRRRRTARAAMSQVRGLGQARPAPAASSGTASASSGRTVTKPAIQLRADRRSAAPSRRRSAGGRGVRPAAGEAVGDRARASTGQSRWQKRLASGGDRSQPSAACSGGLAAATTATLVGQREVADRPLEHDPQQRGLHGRRRGRDLVEERQPVAGRRPAATAQRGGAKSTAAVRRRPAGRRSPTARGSRRSPSRTASRPRRPARGSPRSCRCPGAPHSSTGTRAATATPERFECGWTDPPCLSLPCEPYGRLRDGRVRRRAVPPPRRRAHAAGRASTGGARTEAIAADRAGQALVAVGIVDEAARPRPSSTTDLAAALRGGEHGLMYAAFNESVEHEPLTKPLSPRRDDVVPRRGRAAAGTFELRYVRFGRGDGTNVVGLLTTSTPPDAAGRAALRPAVRGARSPTIAARRGARLRGGRLPERSGTGASGRARGCTRNGVRRARRRPGRVARRPPARRGADRGPARDGAALRTLSRRCVPASDHGGGDAASKPA